jgi:hypothetical protein
MIYGVIYIGVLIIEGSVFKTTIQIKLKYIISKLLTLNYRKNLWKKLQ